MAAEVSKRTKKALGEKFKVHPDLFVVGDERKDQANDASRIKSPASITQFSSKHFWVKMQPPQLSLPISAQGCFG